MSELLLFELRVQEQGFSLDAAEAKGRALPQWYLEAPEREFGYDWFLRAFWQLSTERQIGMSLGPIPVSAIWALADRYELDPYVASVLEAAVAKMDAAFLKHVEPKKPKKSKKKKPRRPHG